MLIYNAVQSAECPVALFYADDGERVGTYQGHSGAVMCIDVTSMMSASNRTHAITQVQLVWWGCALL